jgi:hypothetical protein
MRKAFVALFGLSLAACAGTSPTGAPYVSPSETAHETLTRAPRGYDPRECWAERETEVQTEDGLWCDYRGVCYQGRLFIWGDDWSHRYCFKENLKRGPR